MLTRIIFPALAVAALSAGSASAQNCPGGICPVQRTAAFVRSVAAPVKTVTCRAVPVALKAASCPCGTGCPCPQVAAVAPKPAAMPLPMPGPVKTAVAAPSVPVAGFSVLTRPTVKVTRVAPLRTFWHRLDLFSRLP